MALRDEKDSKRQHRIIHTKAFFAIAVFLLTTIAMPTIFQQPAIAASANLMVSSQDTTGAAINGYWTVVSQNGATVQTGFTPFSTTLNAGTYSVSVSDYGAYTFSHWSDGTTTRAHSVTIPASGSVSLVAVYSTSGGGGGGGGSGSLNVQSTDTSGNPLNGYWTVVSQGSSTVQTGFTPLSTTLSAGTYSVSVSDYGSYFFSKWSDGVTTRAHSVTIGSTAVTLTAVYSTSGGGGGGGGSGSLNVQSTDTSGNPLNGYWTVVSQGSSTVQTGFTPFSTTLNAGTYSVSVSDYGAYTFSHWSDGTTSRAHTVSMSTSGVSLTAIYTSSGGGGGGGGGGINGDGTGASKGGANSITVYAARIPSSYWDPCFALVCSAGTGPGAQMYVALEDASGNVVASAFTDENGYTFTGLSSSAAYYLIYPDDCDYCHNTPHNVVFSHWQDGGTTRPREAGIGYAYTAWYEYVPLSSGNTGS